jgi:hypothetical protein
MKPSLKSSLPPVFQKKDHSGLLIWLVLIMIMLSGVMYLGFKVNEMHALNAFSKDQKNQNVSNPHAALTSKPLIELLHAQPLVGQLIYKTNIIMPDPVSSATSLNREALWQQGQKQLTLVQATVRVAVDLSELTLQSITDKKVKSIVLPPARIVAMQVDNLTHYDTKTGLPSTVQLGLSMTSAQSQDIELQVKHDLCESGVLQSATENARQYVAALLVSEHLSRTVMTTDSSVCRISAS